VAPPVWLAIRVEKVKTEIWLDEDILARNYQGIKKHLEKYRDFDPSKTNAAEMVQ